MPIPNFSSFLHTQGYTLGNKRFKLFSYSPLNFGRPTLWKEKALFEIHSDQLFLSVSFHLSKLLKNLSSGFLITNRFMWVTSLTD